LSSALAISSSLFELYDSVSKGQTYLLDTLCRLFHSENANIQEYPRTEDPFLALFTFKQGQIKTAITKPLQLKHQFILDEHIVAFPFKSNNVVNCYLILQFSQQGHHQALFEPELEALIAHVKEALSMSYKITQQETDLKSIHYVLDHYPIPAIAIDNQLNTLFINQSAHALLQNNSNQLISRKENLLKLCDNENHQQRLKQALTSSLSGDTTENRYLKIDINGKPLPVILIACNSVPNVFRHYARQQVSWMYLLKPDYSQSLKSHSGFQGLSLSSAETILACALFEGKSLNDISEQRHVSKQTVRKQLQSVLRKTHCDSQESLMLFLFESFIHYDLINAGVTKEGNLDD